MNVEIMVAMRVGRRQHRSAWSLGHQPVSKPKLTLIAGGKK